jgi:hypothetical protein
MSLSPEEMRLAATLLDMAAEEFGNHGCNDFDTASLPLPLRDDIVRRMLGDDEFYPYQGNGPDWRIQDWMAMYAMASRLREAAAG